MKFSDLTQKAHESGLIEFKGLSVPPLEVNERTVTGLAAVTGNLDDIGDIIHAGAFAKTLAENGDRIKHLWNHDSSNPPTATIKDIREVKRSELPKEIQAKYPEATGGLIVQREYLTNPRAEEIFQGVVGGALSEMSVGYQPVKAKIEMLNKGIQLLTGIHWKIRHLDELRTFEVSDVIWGANSATITQTKAVTPYVRSYAYDTESGYSSEPFNAEVERAKAEPADLRSMAAYYNPNDSEEKSGYLLLHHKAASNYPVSWVGLKDSMNSLLSGAAKVPKADREEVYEHLVQHYNDIGRSAPEYKRIELAYAITDAQALLSLGIDFKDSRIAPAIQEMEQKFNNLLSFLIEAEPPATALTSTVDAEKMLRRIAHLNRTAKLVEVMNYAE